MVGIQIERSTDPHGAQEGHVVQIVKTDTKGLARFEKVRSGLNYIGIKHPAYAYSEKLNLTRHPPRNSSEKITFEWPSWKPLSTQTVSGVLTGHARTDRGMRPDLSKPVYALVTGTLSRAVSDEVVDYQITDETEKFDFRNVPAGFHFLRVQRSEDQGARWFPSDGYVPVEVDPSAKLEYLNLVLDNAICDALAWGRREENQIH